MDSIDFMHTFGPLFWALMAGLTVLLVGGGYWLGGIIAGKTDTGFGAFMIVVLVTVMIASSVIPMAIFGALGDLMGFITPFAPIDDRLIIEDAMAGFGRIIVAATVSSGSVVAFFVASVIGLARGCR